MYFRFVWLPWGVISLLVPAARDFVVVIVSLTPRIFHYENFPCLPWRCYCCWCGFVAHLPTADYCALLNSRRCCSCAQLCFCSRAQIIFRLFSVVIVEMNLQQNIQSIQTLRLNIFALRKRLLTYCCFSLFLIMGSICDSPFTALLLCIHICATSGWIKRQ